MFTTVTRPPSTPGIRTFSQTGTWVEVLKSTEELQTRLADWRDLAGAAAEINAFYEPTMLLAAAQHVAQGKNLYFVLIYQSAGDGKAPQLIGFFPLERRRSDRGIPLTLLRMWEYDYCYLCTPLIRKDWIRECWRTLFDWLDAEAGLGSILELPFFPAEGPIYQQLVELIRCRGLVTFEVEKFCRAWFQRRGSADIYLEQALTSNKRRDLNRKWRRLEELGKVEFRTLTNEVELPQWCADFLRLEASGWKGSENTAIACKPHGPAYFQALTQSAFADGNLLMLGLYLNDEPLALRCNFLSPPGSFFFKPAYNEEYSRFSPGVHVELETIRVLHERGVISWMDSCTSPDNTLLNSLWLERRTFQTLQIALHGWWSTCVIGAIQPACRWFNRGLGRYRYQEY